MPATPRRLVLDLHEPRPVWALPRWAIAEITAALPACWEVAVVETPADARGDGGGPSAEALAAVRGAEVYIGYGIPEPLFAAATAPPARLRWVHSAAAGVAGSLHPAMRASGVRLTNSAGVHAEPMADTVLAMLAYFARGLDLALAAQRQRRWDKAPFDAPDTPVRELAELSVGIVGLGGIGRAIARRTTALGMRTLACKRRPAEPPPGVELRTGSGALEWLLAESDALVLTLPATPETRGLIGARELQRMRPGAVLVNVGRGTLVDEPALAAALAQGRLRGAGLDVFAREPLPPTSPLWDLSNLLLTPHVSATTHRFWRREVDLILANLQRYLAGEPLLNQVDKEAGY